jgi:hypothetical protein
MMNLMYNVRCNIVPVGFLGCFQGRESKALDTQS